MTHAPDHVVLHLRVSRALAHHSKVLAAICEVSRTEICRRAISEFVERELKIEMPRRREALPT